MRFAQRPSISVGWLEPARRAGGSGGDLALETAALGALLVGAALRL